MEHQPEPIPQYFSELPAEGRQQVERGIELLRRFFDGGTRRAMVDELIEKHEIPDAGTLRDIGEDLRSDMRDALTQKPTINK